MTEKIKQLYLLTKQWFWALPVWKRAILSSLIGAIGGSSVIGFFNKYALYYHAIQQNFRVPVEGVEYLDLAVTLLSFAIISISILGTIIIYSIINFTSNVIVKVFAKTASTRRTATFKIVLMITQLMAAGLSLFRFIAEKLFNQNLDYLDTELQVPNLLIYLFIALLVIIILGFIFMKRVQGRKIFTLISVVLGISLLTSSLFNQSIYQGFLRKIQYGGEIPIQIEYRKADNTQSLTKGLLLIKTNKSLTLRNLESKNIEEIPIERISKIIYEQN